MENPFNLEITDGYYWGVEREYPNLPFVFDVYKDVNGKIYCVFPNRDFSSSIENEDGIILQRVQDVTSELIQKAIEQ